MEKYDKNKCSVGRYLATDVDFEVSVTYERKHIKVGMEQRWPSSFYIYPLSKKSAKELCEYIFNNYDSLLPDKTYETLAAWESELGDQERPIAAQMTVFDAEVESVIKNDPVTGYPQSMWKSRKVNIWLKCVTPQGVTIGGYVYSRSASTGQAPGPSDLTQEEQDEAQSEGSKVCAYVYDYVMARENALVPLIGSVTGQPSGFSLANLVGWN